MNLFRLILLGGLLASACLRAETPAPGPEGSDQSAVLTQEPSSAGDPVTTGKQTESRAKLLQKLSSKLLNHKGQPVSMVVFSPTDFTSAQMGGVVADTLVKSLKKYGNLSVRQEKYVLENLTLGEFRKGMAEFKVDVLVASSIRNTNFDIYIYDRRTPYFIYAHSEPIPEITQLQINEEVAGYYARIMLRRALYRYINDQYYELPRQESAPVLQSEIPRWIASPDSLAQINREMLSNTYLGVSSGGAFAYGTTKKFWNSPLLGLQFGYRIHNNLFGEFAYENSAYNVFILTAKYIFTNRESPFRIGVGLGASYVSGLKVLSPDLNGGLGLGTPMIVGSLSILFPLGDVYLKLENRTFVSPSFNKLMITLMPGILVHF